MTSLNNRFWTRRIVYLALGAWIVLVAPWPTKAQTNSSVTVQVEPYPCEYNISTLSAAHHAAGENGLVIVIARLGDGEHTKDLNRRRLHNARVYLTEFDWRRRPETVITAEGERVKGYGRIELYVQGKLFKVLGVKRNRDLLVGSCEPHDERPVKAESNLYPYLDRKPRKPSMKR